MRGVVIAIIVFLGVAGITGLAVFDVASTPTPKPETCVLATRIFLPDVCVTSCSGQSVSCPANTTRPYAIFFTQAATCGLGTVCLP